MGSEVDARCPCGFRASSLIGGGKQSHTTTCYFPCLCEQCSSFVRVNLFDDDLRCPKCGSANVIPYDDPRLAGAAGKHDVVSWNVESVLGRTLKLTNGTYQCPQCQKMTLTFSPGMLFD
jgi:Zn finger protein HypA/HybF involved in hydrogenase expression